MTVDYNELVLTLLVLAEEKVQVFGDTQASAKDQTAEKSRKFACERKRGKRR